MKRREFIAGTAALLISPCSSQGQGRRRRLGFLAIGDGSGKALNQAEVAFIDALRSLGWIQGKNLTIEYRFSQPADRLTDSVAELMALGPDILIAPGPQAAIALKSATGTIPIVFVGVADPVHLGLIQSLARPGGNMTGVTTNVPDDFFAKRLEILRELVPGASKIAVLINPDNPLQRLYFAEIPRIARHLGVALPLVPATKPEELDIAFASAAAQHADAIIDFGDALTYAQAQRIIALAAKYHLPANYCFGIMPMGTIGIRGRYRRSIPSCGRLCRQDPQGCQTCGPPDKKANEVRPHNQRKDGQSAGPHRADLVADTSRRIDRISLGCAAWAHTRKSLGACHVGWQRANRTPIQLAAYRRFSTHSGIEADKVNLDQCARA